MKIILDNHLVGALTAQKKHTQGYEVIEICVAVKSNVCYTRVTVRLGAAR